MNVENIQALVNTAAKKAFDIAGGNAGWRRMTHDQRNELVTYHVFQAVVENAEERKQGLSVEDIESLSRKITVAVCGL